MPDPPRAAAPQILLEEAQHEDYVLCNALKARRTSRACACACARACARACACTLAQVHVHGPCACASASHALQVRAAVANAMGVVAPPDGSACYEVGGMWLPNRISLLFSGALFWPERRQAHLERMMRNFEADLGARPRSNTDPNHHPDPDPNPNPNPNPNPE